MAEMTGTVWILTPILVILLSSAWHISPALSFSLHSHVSTRTFKEIISNCVNAAETRPRYKTRSFPCPTLPTAFIKSRTRKVLPLHASSSSSNDNEDNMSKNNKKKNKAITNSEYERRQEEIRRQLRTDDVIIGKTSAKKDAQDYPINPQSTEEQWLRQASREEQEIFKYTEIGMEALKTLQLQDADDAFNKVYKLKPNAYLWQAGIVKYYLGDIEQASKLFVMNAITYETKFKCPATEERIWRDACELKFMNGLSRPKQRKLSEQEGGIYSIIPKIPEYKIETDDVEEGGVDDFIVFTRSENRKVMKLTRQLFTATVNADKTAEVLTRAQLMSIVGTYDKNNNGYQQSITIDRKMRRLNSLFYLGLHYDAVGEIEESKKCMQKALKLNPSSGKSSDILQTLPLLHMNVRDWFDNEPVDEDDDDFMDGTVNGRNEKTRGSGVELSGPNHLIYSDPVVEATVMEGVKKMKLTEMQNALRIRGLKTTGSKAALQERLFHSLMDDAGYQSGFAP